MISLKRILLPTDFSSYSAAAIEYATTFADKFGAELHLLYVVQDIVTVVPEPGLAFPPPGDYLQESTKSAQQALAKVLDPQWAQGHKVERVVKQGAPFLEILRYSKEQNSDMIVMGTHGRTGLVHVLLGSVAEKIVRKASCPVLTVRPRDHKFAMP